jgi:hypothetical protein
VDKGVEWEQGENILGMSTSKGPVARKSKKQKEPGDWGPENIRA